MTYSRRERIKARSIVGHRNALRYLCIDESIDNIMWLRRIRAGRKRGARYYYKTDRLDALWYELHKEEILKALRALR